MPLRYYTNTATTGTLALPVGTGDTSLSLTGFSNLPSFPFYIIVDRDTVSEEAMLATGGNAANLIVTRGFDGTTAFSHSPGAKVQHAILAEFLNKADAHVESSVNVHGLSGGAAVVGTTSAQTLTSKTVNASVIDLAHSTSPAASQAVKVSADAATARDGFVWDNTGASTGKALRVRSGGTDRAVVDANGLLALNSTTGTDQVFKTQQAGVDRAIITAAGAATVTSLASSGAVSGTTGTFSGALSATTGTFTGQVDAPTVNINNATATNANLQVRHSGVLRGSWRADGLLELPVPIAGDTNPRLVIRSVASGGGMIEGYNSTGNIGFRVGNGGGLSINNSAGVAQFTADNAGVVMSTGQISAYTDKVRTQNYGSGNYGVTTELFHTNGGGTATTAREERQSISHRFNYGAGPGLTGSEAVIYESSWSPRNNCHADITGFVHYQVQNGAATNCEASECITRLRIYTDPGLVLVYDSSYDYTVHTFEDDVRNIQGKAMCNISDLSDVVFTGGTLYRVRLFGLSGTVLKSTAIGGRLVIRESVRVN